MTVHMDWDGPEVEAALRAAAARGVAKSVEHLLGVSRARTPKEEGTLRRSGVASTDGLKGAVSYDTPYAARQHEELTWRHQDGQTAKFLEVPLIEEDGVMRAMIATEIRRALRS